jgi:lipopolysaccharide assembly outer membrane protein LptD (OstA)
MKTGLLIMCLTLLPLAAQDNSGIKHLTVGPLPNGRPAVAPIRLAARDLDQIAGIVYLKGSVEINLGTYALLADEAEYDQNSGEIQASGNVHLKPAESRNSRGAIQFGIK